MTQQTSTRTKMPRLCFSMSEIKAHLESVRQYKDAARCQVCGENSYWRCTMCEGNPAMHVLGQNRSYNGCKCAIEYHDPNFFGLARNDTKLLNKGIHSWKQPSDCERKDSTKHICRIQRHLCNDDVE